MNHKLVQGSDEKKLTGLYLYSNELSIGKSALLKCISEIALTYRHCLTDNGQQETYDSDAIDEEAYKAYLIDGFNEIANYDFSLLENICDFDVNLKRRGNVPGTLKKKTPFIITSNLSPNNLLGNLRGDILKARALIINCTGVTLFGINIIRNLHGLQPFVPSILNFPSDLN